LLISRLLLLISLTLTLLLPYAAPAQEPPPAAAPNRPDFPRRVVVHVTGGAADNERTVLGNSLLAALVNSGACIPHQNAATFFNTASDMSRRQIILDDNRLSDIGRQFGIKYICVASLTPAFGAPGNFTIFARMLNTETGAAKLNGEYSGPLNTAQDLTAAANTVVEKMLGRRAPAPQAPPTPETNITTAPTPPAPFETSVPGPAAPEIQAAPINGAPADTAAQGKQTVAVYMAGNEPKNAKGVHNILGGELARVMSESDKYTAVDRTEAILAQLDREHVYQRSGAVDDEQIKAIGHQLGVQYLCISNINPVGKRYYLDTRLVDIVTAEIMRSVTATSSLKDANEMTRVGRNIALELLEADKTRQQRALRKTIFRSVAVSLDIFGLLALGYGYIENRNVIKLNEEEDYPEADRAATRRNAAYIAGGALIASGVVIHIAF